MFSLTKFDLKIVVVLMPIQSYTTYFTSYVVKDLHNFNLQRKVIETSLTCIEW